ncbi:putative glycoside hydrolase [Aureliella helgolandensis]|uniref:Right handed beta helix domain-containing protein n=1 Tax=Aureliella helgolandensis TaxID=2527968 RepID=A0A518GCT3_9BACT|nr:putative glycoside hydrolase [Aureliella helgolandensis]QDV26383.1 hypothetical protein Q31a_47570 [Aureliella helgolandensis]
MVAKNEVKPADMFIESKQFFGWLFLVLVVFVVRGECWATDIYVSVGGHAQADGSATKPYGTIPDAVNAVRALRKSGNTAPAVIYLREGRHQLNQVLVLGLEDGNPISSKSIAFEKYGAGETSEADYLTFAAYPGERPIVSGAMPVTGWKRLESAPAELSTQAVGRVWVADMPAGLGRFQCLFDGRGRLRRARGAGFAYTKPGNQRTLHFPAGALKAWDNLEDVEIQVRPGRPWVINMLPLESVDEVSGTATTGVSATYGMSPLPGWVHNPSGATVWVENTLTALDEPGEWVVNTRTRKIYLWPSDPAADGSPHGILAPTTSELIRVEGTIDYDGPKDTPVRGIAFSGLTFTHADRLAWTNDENRLGWGLQHDWDMFDRPTAMLRFRGAEECRVTSCRFLYSGGSGVRMDLHAQRNRVEDCEFAHLGEAGILLAGYGPGTKDVNHHNSIINNYIHHFSEITWHSPGFWAWQSGHNRISHNELHHSGYAAVLITTRVNPSRDGGGANLDGEGARTVRRHEITPKENQARNGYEDWRNREKYIHSRHNLVEYNEISHSVQLLSDGNGIYVSGAGTGNIVRYNYLHDNQAHSLPAAIRCDDDQHDTLIYGNVLYKNHGFSASIASKGVNDIINNFIVDPVAVPRWGYLSFEWVPVTGSKVHRNIIISHPEGGNAYAARPRGGTRDGGEGPKLEQTDMDSNLYFHPTDPAWMDERLSKMRAIGKEKASLLGDPLFTDPAAGDFSFQPGSPALQLGIEPLDVSQMGRKKLDGSATHYPAFSWDHVPLYMHMRKATDFTQEELEYLAGFPLITLEKTTGSSTYGSTEDGSRAAAKAIKAVNRDACVLYYRNVMCNYSTYKVNSGLKDIPGAFLQDSDGNRKLHRGVRKVYDLSNPELRKWWVDHCVEMVGYDEIDGIFLDGNIKALEPAFLDQEIGSERKQAVAEGYTAMMKELRDRIPENKMLVANIIRARLTDSGLSYMPYFDGSYLEGIESPANGLTRVEYLANGIAAVQKAARQGKIICMSIGLGKAALTGLKIDDSRKKLARGANIQPRLEYCLALFLICAEKYSYFLPHDGYDVNYNRSSVWLTRFPEYDKPLGPPLGPAIQNGTTYTRDFESASVFLDIEKQAAKITWK